MGGVCRDFVQCRYEIRERVVKIDIFQGVSLLVSSIQYYNGNRLMLHTRKKSIETKR